MTNKSITINDINIRTDLHSGDIGYITYLHGITYSKERNHGIAFESIVAGGLHEFYSTYNPKNERIWIAQYNDDIIGCIALKNRGKAAQLRYFLILPEYRGIGLGNKLMQLYMAFLKSCGYRSSYLWTTHELDTAGHLYTKYGFELTEEKTSTEFGKTLKEQRYDLTLI